MATSVYLQLADMRAPTAILGQRCRARLALRAPWGVLLVAVRVIVALLAMQASGVPHVLADVFVTEGRIEHMREDCPDDDDSCPPGCPSCHVCGHTQAIYVPPAFGLEVPVHTVPIVGHDIAERAPPSRPPPPFFRPPRA